jgi:hypothetical protein
LDAPEPTAANADLWATYFRNEWRRWLSPFGGPSIAPVEEVADGTAARVAGLLSLVAAPTIGWMYRSNAPQVTGERSEAEQAADASVQAIEIHDDAEEAPVVSTVEREETAA